MSPPGFVLGDWPKKKKDLCDLSGQSGLKGMCSAVYRGAPVNPDLIVRMYKWTQPRFSTNDTEFFEKVKVFLGCDPLTKASRLIECSHQEWRKLMSAQRRRELLQRGRTNVAQFFIDLEDHPSKPEALWIRDRAVNSQFAYLSRASVDGWHTLITYGENYSLYEDCEDVLKKFLNSDSKWKALVKSGKIGSIVILGAGAESKDREILNNLCNKDYFSTDGHLKYVVFDNSFFMLTDTYAELEKFIVGRGCQGKIEPVACVCNFLNLKRWEDELRPHNDDQVAVFFVLGGTIGNLNERLLLESIGEVARPGDLLIIGNDFIRGSDLEVCKKSLLEIYDRDDTRDFVLAAVQKLLDSENISRDDAERRALVDVQVNTTSELPSAFATHLPGTLAPVFRLTVPIKGVRLALAVAKKFTEDALTAACQTQYFKHCGVHRLEKKETLEKKGAADNPTPYEYHVFERQEPGAMN